MLDGLSRIEHENRHMLGKLFRRNGNECGQIFNIEKLRKNRADVKHMGKPR
jgi:hypothetical protein